MAREISVRDLRNHTRAGRRPRNHDTWIAATALRHDAAVVTQDADFGAFGEVQVIRV